MTNLQAVGFFGFAFWMMLIINGNIKYYKRELLKDIENLLQRDDYDD